MGVSASDSNNRRLRLLVAIASYGRKNDLFLKQIIQQYRSMAMEVDIIVMSEAAKELGSEVKVIVGLPSPNPWSLPFAHKAVFAQNVDRYDLFAYSEDDMNVTEQNVQAFLRVTPQLQADEIAGFLRYEADQFGNSHVPEAHDSAHWKPETVKRRGSNTVAEFSNEHAGFYLLTQSQLKKVIASGNYLKSPYEGRYGMPETAATDPYTCCGFRKVICISAIDDFLIHHLPNRYIGQFGTLLSVIKQQVQTLMEICSGAHPVSTLCPVESKVIHGRWSKSYDEKPCDELLAAIPEGIQNLLSVGCGSGAFEEKLIQRRMAVTALPLDSVIGAMAARLGIEMIFGNLEEGMEQLAGRKFDSVVIINLLHLQLEPEKLLTECAQRVDEGGTLLVAGPNFNRIPTMINRFIGVGDFKKLQDFAASSINPLGVKFVKRHLKKLGFRKFAVQWFDRTPPQKHLAIRRVLGRFAAWDWVLQARR